MCLQVSNNCNVKRLHEDCVIRAVCLYHFLTEEVQFGGRVIVCKYLELWMEASLVEVK